MITYSKNHELESCSYANFLQMTLSLTKVHCSLVLSDLDPVED